MDYLRPGEDYLRPTLGLTTSFQNFIFDLKYLSTGNFKTYTSFQSPDKWLFGTGMKMGMASSYNSNAHRVFKKLQFSQSPESTAKHAALIPVLKQDFSIGMYNMHI